MYCEQIMIVIAFLFVIVPSSTFEFLTLCTTCIHVTRRRTVAHISIVHISILFECAATEVRLKTGSNRSSPGLLIYYIVDGL
jgi:hypothetical protein